MRLALVHDWLTGLRGGERVLDELAALYPDADLYTLFHVRGATSPRIDRLRIAASALNRIPGARRHYRKLLPLFPWAIGRFRLEGYDLVLSISHAVAKGVRVVPPTPHLCYCLTPMRYVWDQVDLYLGRGPRRLAAAPLLAYLRHFDRRMSAPQRITRFTAISRTVADRIRRRYAREAAVVYPPVDVERIRPNGRAPEDFYLLVGGFVAYKREDLAIEAFGRLGRRLVVVGEGPARTRLQGRAASNIEFTGRISDRELAELYGRCRALVFPQEEDFGIAAVEAQAAGRAVIAYGRGGARESVVPLARAAEAGARPPTGIWFEPQTCEALMAAVHRFEGIEGEFDPSAIRAHAERFGAARFRSEMRGEIQGTLGRGPR